MAIRLFPDHGLSDRGFPDQPFLDHLLMQVVIYYPDHKNLNELVGECVPLYALVRISVDSEYQCSRNAGWVKRHGAVLSNGCSRLSVTRQSC